MRGMRGMRDTRDTRGMRGMRGEGKEVLRPLNFSILRLSRDFF